MLVAGGLMVFMLPIGLLKLQLSTLTSDATTKMQRMLVAGGWILSMLPVGLLKLQLSTLTSDATMKMQRMLVAGGWMLSELPIGLLKLQLSILTLHLSGPSAPTGSVSENSIKQGIATWNQNCRLIY
jgi:hypothetical protein